jgi:hypothetical protein
MTRIHSRISPASNSTVVPTVVNCHLESSRVNRKDEAIARRCDLSVCLAGHTLPPRCSDVSLSSPLRFHSGSDTENSMEKLFVRHFLYSVLGEGRERRKFCVAGR